MVVADLLVQETYTEKLKVPDGFQVTLPENRTWIIEPLGSDDISGIPKNFGGQTYAVFGFWDEVQFFLPFLMIF